MLRQRAGVGPFRMVVLDQLRTHRDAELLLQPADDDDRRVVGGKPLHHVHLLLMGELGSRGLRAASGPDRRRPAAARSRRDDAGFRLIVRLAKAAARHVGHLGLEFCR
jgi:hypothetical protein